MKPYVLYRPGQMTETDEMDAITSAFGDACGDEIEDIPAGSLVFPRYCAIPSAPTWSARCSQQARAWSTPGSSTPSSPSSRAGCTTWRA